MSIHTLASLPVRALHRVQSFAGRRLYFTSDQAGWAVDWYTRYLADNLRKNHRVPAATARDARGFRGQALHFADRHGFFSRCVYRETHSSNACFLTWMHQDPDLASDARAQLIAQMPAAMERMRGVVTTCETTRRALLELGAPEERLHVIPLGVDVERFRPPSDEERQRARAVLGIPADAIAIGSFQKDGNGWGEGAEPKLIKGPDVFLRVVEQLAQRGRKLFIVLSGPARGFVKTGLERLGVPYSHQFLRDYFDVVKLYHALDFYLITSRCEGGPLSLMESWATATAVISTAMGMPLDHIRDGENGLLASNGDVEQLTAQAERLLDRPELAERLRAAGLQDAPRFDWREIAAAHYRKLYAPLFS